MTNNKGLTHELWDKPDVKKLALEVAEQELFPPKVSKWRLLFAWSPNFWIGALIGRLSIALGERSRRNRLSEAVHGHVRQTHSEVEPTAETTIVGNLVELGKYSLKEALREMQRKQATGQPLNRDQSEILKRATELGLM